MAARFWVPQPASAIADNGSGKCRIAVTSTTGMTSGDTRNLFGFTGTTGLNGAQTITVIDGTHLDVSAISFVATGTGSINGRWDANNTNNWATTSNGSTLAAAPVAADTVTFDGSSGTGLVEVATTINGVSNQILSLTTALYTGTFDASFGNPAVVITASAAANGVVFSSALSRTIKLGTSSWHLANGSAWDFTTITNLGGTSDLSACTVLITGATTGSQLQQSVTLGALAYGTITINPRTSAAAQGVNFVPTSGCSIVNLNINGPAWAGGAAASSFTVTNLTINGSSTGLVLFGALGASSSAKWTITVTVATINYAALRNITFAGIAVTANNSYNFGEVNMNSGAINAPASGAGGVIGG